MTRDLERHIDLVLGFLTETWQEVPTVAREIDAWDLLDRVSYPENWTPNDQLLERLQQFAADGLMTPEQTTRYRALLELVEQNQPYLDQILR